MLSIAVMVSATPVGLLRLFDRFDVLLSPTIARASLPLGTIRTAASVAQLFALISLPRRARIWRLLSRRSLSCLLH